ncbi:MAG: hypothetical protein K2X27_19725, partial [Candidatus Obscuribacterales bacterium]|nr:hypothetical protein [Candidatus Obscuribacterales bacterium]
MTEAARPSNPKRKRADKNAAPTPPAGEDAGIESNTSGPKLVSALPSLPTPKASSASEPPPVLDPSHRYSMQSIGRPLTEVLENYERSQDDISKIRRAYEFAFKS